MTALRWYLHAKERPFTDGPLTARCPLNTGLIASQTSEYPVLRRTEATARAQAALAFARLPYSRTSTLPWVVQDRPAVLFAKYWMRLRAAGYTAAAVASGRPTVAQSGSGAGSESVGAIVKADRRPLRPRASRT